MEGMHGLDGWMDGRMEGRGWMEGKVVAVLGR